APRPLGAAVEDDVRGAGGRPLHHRGHARRGGRPLRARPSGARRGPPPARGPGVEDRPYDDHALHRADGREGHPRDVSASLTLFDAEFLVDPARAHHQRPVLPCPPSPRSDGGRLSTTSSSARSTRRITSWAMRSPRLISTVVAGSQLTAMTLIS